MFVEPINPDKQPKANENDLANIAGIIGPEIAGIIGPEIGGIIGPDYAGIIGPEVFHVDIIGPDYVGIIGPEMPDIIGPDYAGIIGPEVNRIIGPEVYLAKILVSEDLVKGFASLTGETGLQAGSDSIQAVGPSVEVNAFVAFAGLLFSILAVF